MPCLLGRLYGKLIVLLSDPDKSASFLRVASLNVPPVFRKLGDYMWLDACDKAVGACVERKTVRDLVARQGTNMRFLGSDFKAVQVCTDMAHLFGCVDSMWHCVLQCYVIWQHLRSHTTAHVHTSKHVHLLDYHIHAYMYMCICTYTHMYMYIYTHTGIQTCRVVCTDIMHCRMRSFYLQEDYAASPNPCMIWSVTCVIVTNITVPFEYIHL